MKRIENDAELLELHVQEEGYIYNDYSGPNGGPKFNVLHEASCYTCNPNYPMGMHADIPKYFFDHLEEAERWLNENRNDRHNSCGTCMG